MAAYPEREKVLIEETGDPDLDSRTIEDMHKRARRLAEQMCPNGCGAMGRARDGIESCNACGFVHDPKTN